MTEKKENIAKSNARFGGYRTVLILTLLVLLTALLCYLGLQTRFGRNLISNNTQTEQTAAPSGVLLSEPGPMTDLREFLVNIISEDNSRYLKTSITVELSDTSAQDEIQARMPQVRDSILMLISNKTFEELYDLHGKKQLKAELTLTVNELLSRGEVTAVYFTDFILQ